MRMTRRLAIVIAVICGLIAGLLTYVYLRSVQQRVRPEEVVQKIAVVTPTEEIPAGTVIRDEMLATIELPEGEVTPGVAHSAQQVTSCVSIEKLPAGQPIRLSRLRSPDQLSYRVPEGMRAVTVAIDPVAGVAGFLKAGDRVDVIATFEIGEAAMTRTILQNVELLALGTIAAPVEQKPAKEGEGEVEAKPEEQPNATLAVDPEQAQKLVLSEARGKLRLALRPKFEDQHIAVKPTDLTEIIGEEFAELAKAEAKPPAAKPPAGEEVAPRATLARGFPLSK